MSTHICAASLSPSHPLFVYHSFIANSDTSLRLGSTMGVVLLALVGVRDVSLATNPFLFLSMTLNILSELYIYISTILNTPLSNRLYFNRFSINERQVTTQCARPKCTTGLLDFYQVCPSSLFVYFFLIFLYFIFHKCIFCLSIYFYLFCCR